MNKKIGLALGLPALVAVAAYAAYSIGMKSGMTMASGAASIAPAQDGRRVLYWHDPMVPGHKFDKPGKSPFMDMQLVPVYADDAAGANAGVRIDPAVQQNLGMRTASATRMKLGESVEVVGNVAYDERDVAVIQARANGFIERLHVRAPLDPVRQGQALLDMYVPDWVAAQEDWLTAQRLGDRAPKGLLDAARQRMRLAGMSETQVQRVEREGQVQPRLTIASPIAGVVTELSAREGMSVTNGAPLFRINGLQTVWVVAQVPEAAAASVRPGTEAGVRTAAFPHETFHGRVTALLPEVDPATRTLKARVEVANRDMKLAPGMFATVAFAPSAQQEVLAIPSEAVIRTGTRALVMVADAQGRFRPVEVEAGSQARGQTEIRKGLAEGDKVAVSGQFLIDSEASLKGIEARTTQPEAMPAASTAAQTHHGEGKVESVGQGEITLSHGPIPTLQWPAMTMGFKVAPEIVPKDLKPGDSVSFDTRQAEGGFAITALQKKAVPQ